MPGSVDVDSRVGTEIAGYRIERVLGRGGMAVVYLAHHERLDRHVALKLLAPELAEDEQFRERFLRESKLAVSLDHPNVIPIHDADEADGVLFIAMRYVEGTGLGRLLKGEEPVSPAGTLAILDRVASALDAAHARGLVHRDVKPENVLLAEAAPGEPEHVYLTDFGLSTRLGDEQEADDAAGLLGSLDYLAPEQIRDQPVTAQTDVYALGCVLFRALTGEAPFSGGGRLVDVIPRNVVPSGRGGVDVAGWAVLDACARPRAGPGLPGDAAVAAGPAGFVAVGITIDDEVSLDAAVWTSPDGERWQRGVAGDDVFGGPPYEEGRRPGRAVGRG